MKRNGTRRHWLCYGLGGLICTAVLASFPLPAQEPLTASRYLSVRSAPGQGFGPGFRAFVKSQGSHVRHIVKVPAEAGGGEIASVLRPKNESAFVKRLQSRVRGGFVEHDSCREFLPREPFPELPKWPELGGGPGAPIGELLGSLSRMPGGRDARVLVTRQPPVVEDFVAGKRIPWDPAAPYFAPAEQAGKLRVGLELIESGWEMLVGVGWNSERIRGGGTRERPGDGETPPSGGETGIPGEEEPPRITSIPRENVLCSAPQRTVLPGPGIQVAFRHGDPATFPYPRPIPLQALARDYDEVKIRCKGCAGNSLDVRYLEDQITEYQWKILSGPGSLNKPYREIEDYEETEKKIQKVRREIREKSAELAQLKEKRAQKKRTREARRKKLQANIERLKLEKENARTRILEGLNPRITELERRRQAAEKERAQERTKIATIEQDIKKKQEEIDKLEGRIRGEPSPKEKELAGKLEAQKKKIEKLKAKLAALEKRHDIREKKLIQNYDKAQAKLLQARQALQQARNRVRASQKRILDLQNRLYNVPAVRDLMQGRAEVEQIARRVSQRYMPELGATPAQALVEALGYALQAGSPGARQAARQRFDQERSRLLQRMKHACKGSAGCLAEVRELESSLERVSGALDNIASRGLIDPKVQEQIEEERKRLAALDKKVSQAEARVDNARKGVDQAQQDYVDGLDAMMKEYEEALDRIRQAEEEQKRIELELDAASKLAEQERLDKTPKWLQRIDKLRREITQLREQIARQRDTVEQIQNRIAGIDAELAKLKSERQALEDLVAYKDQQIAQRQAELKALEKEDSAYQTQIQKKQTKIKALEATLRKLEQGKDPKKTEQRSATGQQVYYIPPPLELVPGFNKKRFDQLKEEVATAEAELEKRRGEKAQLQDRAFDLLRRMNEGLWSLRTAKDAFKKIEEEAAKLKGALDEKKREEAHKRTQKAGKLLKQESRARERAKQADGDYIKAVEQTKKRQDEMMKKKKALSDMLEQIKQQKKPIGKQVTRNRSLAKRLHQAEERLQNARNELDQLIGKLRKDEMAHSSAVNAVARADALGDEARASAARSRASELGKQIKNARGKVLKKRQEVQQLAKAFKQQQLAYREGIRALRTLEKQLRRMRKEAEKMTEDLRDRITAYDAAMEYQQKASRKLREAEAEAARLKKEAEAAKARTQEVDQDPDIQEAQKAVDEKNKEKEKLEKDVEKAKIELKGLADARKQWKKDRQEADKRIQVAEKALEKARQEMKKFLEGEFRKVRFRVEIEMKILNQKPLDGWRKPDGSVTKKVIIRFDGKRKPVIEGPKSRFGPPPPKHIAGTCDSTLTFKQSGMIQPNGPVIEGKEPQTIALFYKQGQPLYDLWPPRRDPEDVLGYSATPAVVRLQDVDRATYACTAKNNTACQSSPPNHGDARDPGHPEWLTSTHTSPKEPRTMLDVPPVPKTLCEDKDNIALVYRDSRLQFSDQTKGRFQYVRKPGMVGDAPAQYVGFGSDDRVTLRFQLFEGAHRGLPGEVVEFKVESHMPKSLKADQFGFNGSDKQATRTTDGSGYARVDFMLKARHGEVKIRARWLRKGKQCKAVEIRVRREYRLRELYAGLAPDSGWEQARKMWEGSDDYDGLAEALPEEGQERKPAFAAGLVDDQLDPVNGRKIEFSLGGGKTGGPGGRMKPKEKATVIHGFAWSFAEDVGEDVDVVMQARTEKDIRPFTKPDMVQGKASTRTIDEFLIGPGPDRYLTIGTEESFALGEPYSGEARLVIKAQGIPAEFQTLKLTAEQVVVEERNGRYVAVSGSVSWDVKDRDGKPFEFKKAGFGFTLETLGLTAGADGKLTGKAKIPGKKEEAGFSAIIGPGGFYGEADNFPEIEFATMKLEKGASVVVDMHDKEDPPDPLEGWSGRGLLIREAKLVLPEALKGRREQPPVIGVKGFFFNSAGLTGEISLDYTISAGMGKVEFAIDHVEVGLKQNELVKAAFKGKATFPDPFQGALGMSVNLDREGNFTIEAETGNPITAPRFGLTFQISNLVAKYEKKIFTFKLSANLKSESFSDISITGFEINSKGEVRAKEIGVNKDVRFGPGFDVHLASFGFEKTEKDYSITLDTRFQFSRFLKAEKAKVTISAGPRIDSFDLSVKGNRKPVEFASKVRYRASVFSGDLKVKVRNVMQVQGRFVMGTQKVAAKDSFTYWYIELVSSASIPLAQTGLVINEIGGGVGYNYEPPIGHSGGTVVHSERFAFKASVGMGNAPKGEAFSGRLTMVLVQNRFSLNGKVWLLQREDSLYGEGQLNLIWKNPSRLDGHVTMLLALPDAGGKLTRFKGQVDFRFGGGKPWYVRSRELDGSVLERLIAEGSIDIRPGLANLKGSLRYDMTKTVGITAASLKVEVHLKADGSVKIRVTPKMVSFDTRLGFSGSLDVDLVTSVKTINIVSGRASAKLRLAASNTSITVEGKVRVAWKTWVHSGSENVEIGYHM